MRDGLIRLLERAVKDFDEAFYARLYANKHHKDFPLIFLGTLAAGWKGHCRFFSVLRNIFRYVERTTYENFQLIERPLFHSIVFEKVKGDALHFANEIQNYVPADMATHCKMLKQLQHMFSTYGQQFMDAAALEKMGVDAIEEPSPSPPAKPSTTLPVCFASSDGLIFDGENALALLTMSTVLQGFFHNEEEF